MAKTAGEWLGAIRESIARRKGDRNSRAFITIGVVAAVLVTTLAAGLGAAQKANLVSLLDGHGWLTNSSNGEVQLANGATAKIDLELQVAGATGHQLKVLQAGSNAVLVDDTAGTVGSINLADIHTQMKGIQVAATGHASDVDVETSADTVFVIHRKEGVIQARNPVSGKVVGQASVRGTLTPGVTDSSGRLWVVDATSGALLSATVVNGHLRMGNGAQIVAPKSSANEVELVLADGVPAVADLRNGTFVSAPDGAPGPAVAIPSISGLSASSVQLATEITGTTVPIAVSGSGVVLVHLSSNATASSAEAPIQPPGIGLHDRIGAPQAYNGRIYVPDQSAEEVIVLNDHGSVVAAPIKLPWSKGAVELSIQGGFLWMNQPDGGSAMVVNPEGQAVSINKNDPVAITNVKPPTPPALPNPPPIIPPVNPVPPPQTRTPPAPTLAVAPQAPSAPTNVTAFAGNDAATLSWSPSQDGGSPVTGYTIKWTATQGKGSSGSQRSLTSPATISGLTNGTTYAFVISATNAVGTSAESNPPATATPSGDVPDAPTDVKATANSNGSIGLSWSAAGGEGHAITSYSILLSDSSATGSGSSSAPANVSASGSATQATLTSTNGGIQLGDNYTFSIIATSSSGKASLPSNTSNSVTAHEPPLAVTGLTATPDGDGQLEATWTCDPGDPTCSGGSAVTSFTVTTSPAGASAAPLSVPAVAGQSSYTAPISGLTNGTDYRVTIAACNALGCTASSKVAVSGIATPFGAPGTPGMSAPTVNGNTITWSWSSPSGNGSPIANFKISLDGTPVVQALQNSYSGTFGCGQSHTLTVEAVNAGGAEGGVGSAGAPTTACPPPPAVSITPGNASPACTSVGGSSGCYWVHVTLTGFPPNSPITFMCIDRTGTFWTNPGSQGFGAWYSTDANGNQSWSPAPNVAGEGCADSNGFTVHVTVTVAGVTASSPPVLWP
jgi:hypothetical protein